MNIEERSYVVFAPTAWEGPRQLGHSLAEALAARLPVLFVDPPVSPLSPIRYGLRRATLPRAREALRRRVRRVGPLYVFTPLALPPLTHPRMRELSLPSLRWQISRAARSARLDAPVLLAAHWLPELAGAVSESLRVALVVDHPSAGAAMMGIDPAGAEAEKAALCDAADLTLTTSQALHDLLAEQGRSSEMIPAGFDAGLAEAFDRATEPPEYAGLPRPLLGYTGSIDDRLDFDLVVALADRFRSGSILFVGGVSPRISPASRRALAARPNIHLLGHRSQAQLPGYISHLDLALLPYRDSVFTRYQSPIKVWEYLYAGTPILGAGSPALRSYPPPLVEYADSPEHALSLAEGLISGRGEEGREARRSFALANTWKDRAERLDEAVAARLAAGRDETAQSVPAPLLSAAR